MLTLIVCLFLDFIYIQYKKNKKTKQKDIVNKTKKRWKKIIKYIESQYILFNLLKMKIQLKRQIRRRKRDVLKQKRGKTDERKEREKWTEGTLGGSYIVIFQWTK